MKWLFSMLFPRKAAPQISDVETQSAREAETAAPFVLKGYLYPDRDIKCPYYELDGNQAIDLINNFNLENAGLMLVPLGDANEGLWCLDNLETGDDESQPNAPGDFQAYLNERRAELHESSEGNSAFPRGETGAEEPPQPAYLCSVVNLVSNPQVPFGRVLAVAIPSEPAWGAMMHIPFGGWNDCPFDEIHLAAHKKWFEKYGASLEGMSRDVLTFTVANPPRSMDAAMELAFEQYLYCQDIVDQGVGTIDALASGLINRERWFFWWD